MAEQGWDGTQRGQGAMLPEAPRTAPSALQELRAEPPLQEQGGETSSPRKDDGCCCCGAHAGLIPGLTGGVCGGC